MGMRIRADLETVCKEVQRGVQQQQGGPGPTARIQWCVGQGASGDASRGGGGGDGRRLKRTEEEDDDDDDERTKPRRGGNKTPRRRVSPER